MSGCFSPFPHGTGSLSVIREYLGLEGGPPMFRQDFTCPALLKDLWALSHTGLSPISPDFPDRSATCPKTTGLFRVRSPLLAESLLMSFPPGTEMFQFPGFASMHYVFMHRSPCGGVAPFGYPRIKACSRLPMAFRSVPRPSSPPDAKASTERPYRALSRASHSVVGRRSSVVKNDFG